MGQENIISIDLQTNLGLIDPVIRGIEEINEKMNGAAPLIWDQACHTKLLAVHRLYSSLIYWSAALSMYAPCVTMLPPSDLFLH